MSWTQRVALVLASCLLYVSPSYAQKTGSSSSSGPYKIKVGRLDHMSVYNTYNPNVNPYPNPYNPYPNPNNPYYDPYNPYPPIYDPYRPNYPTYPNPINPRNRPRIQPYPPMPYPPTPYPPVYPNIYDPYQPYNPYAPYNVPQYPYSPYFNPYSPIGPMPVLYGNPQLGMPIGRPGVGGLEGGITLALPRGGF